MDNATRRQILERVKQLGYPNTVEALQNPQILDQYEQQQLQAQSQQQQQQPIQQQQPVSFPTPPVTTPNYKVPQPIQSEAKPLVMSFNETPAKLMRDGGAKEPCGNGYIWSSTQNKCVPHTSYSEVNKTLEDLDSKGWDTKQLASEVFGAILPASKARVINAGSSIADIMQHKPLGAVGGMAQLIPDKRFQTAGAGLAIFSATPWGNDVNKWLTTPNNKPQINYGNNTSETPRQSLDRFSVSESTNQPVFVPKNTKKKFENGGPKDKGWREYKTPTGESLYLDPRFKDQRYYVNEKGNSITPDQNMSLFDVQDNIWESGTSMTPLEIKSNTINYSSTSADAKKNYQSNLKNSSYKQDREYLKPDDINWYETLNYKKWGLKDYSNYSSFNSAFRNAKESGEKEFVWNDERYNTNLAPKEVSDNYHDSKKFLQEYYANEPFFTLDTSMYGKLSAWEDYTKNKYGTTWGDYYDKVSGTPEYENSDNPKYNKIHDTLYMLNEPMYYSRFPQEAKDYHSKSIRDKYLKSLNDPSYYFSITSQPDPNEPVLGYQDAGNKAFYVSNTNTPGKFNTTSVHELSHKADTEDRIAYRNENSRIPEVNIDDLNRYGSSLSQERFNYVSEPTETEARKMSTLYYLNRAKKVNVKSGKITEDQLDALYKEAGHYRDTDSKVPDDVKDLLELYRYQKTDLLKYLNNDFNYTKKYGGIKFDKGGPKDKGWQEFKTPTGQSLFLDPRFKNQRYYVDEQGNMSNPDQNLMLYDVNSKTWEAGTSMPTLEIQENTPKNKGILSTIKTAVNPKNWGVSDYTNDYPDRHKAFAAARKAGEKEFLYNGVRYPTIQEGERSENAFDLNLEERTRIFNSVRPDGYPASEIVPAIKRYITGTSFKDEVSDNKFRAKVDEDAWAFFMGVPQEKNSITKSKYKPSNAKDTLKQYYTLRNGYSNFEDMVLDDANRMFNPQDETAKDNTISNNRNKVVGRTNFYPLENATYTKGKDDRGDYYSIYDVYDFSVPFEEKIGKPYEVYDRVYYKDYGDGKQTPMYYSDKELSELDANKKNFDTLALQRELANRGYELPNSTTEIGKFDGVLGNETIQALQNWQNKNPKKFVGTVKFKNGGKKCYTCSSSKMKVLYNKANYKK
jgi:hypothetical protein